MHTLQKALHSLRASMDAQKAGTVEVPEMRSQTGSKVTENWQLLTLGLQQGTIRKCWQIPNRQVHNCINKLVLGRDFSEVNRILDLPARFLGASHRRMLHDITGCVAGGIVSLSTLGIAAAGIHILLDTLCTQNKNVEQILHMVVKSEEKKRGKRHDRGRVKLEKDHGPIGRRNARRASTPSRTA